MVAYGAWGQIGSVAHIAQLPRWRFVRHMPLISATSSNADDPGRYGYLHTSLSTLRHSDAVSEVENEIAISRELK